MTTSTDSGKSFPESMQWLLYTDWGLSLCENGYVGPGSCLALVVYNSSEKQAPGKSLRLYLEDIDSP